MYTQWEWLHQLGLMEPHAFLKRVVANRAMKGSIVARLNKYSYAKYLAYIELDLGWNVSNG